MPDRLARIVLVALGIAVVALCGLAWRTAVLERQADANAEAARTHRENAEALTVQLRGVRGQVLTLTDALADSTDAWRGRAEASEEREREALARADELNERLTARLDSVGRIMLDSLTAEHRAALDASHEREAINLAGWEAEKEVSGALRLALAVAEARGDEALAAADYFEGAYQAQQSVTRSLRRERDMTRGVAAASVVLNVVQFLRGR